MLILSRNLGQQIRIGDDIILKVLAVNGKQVTIGIEAPRSVSVDREEIYQRKKASTLNPSSATLAIAENEVVEEEFIA